MLGADILSRVQVRLHGHGMRAEDDTLPRETVTRYPRQKGREDTSGAAIAPPAKSHVAQHETRSITSRLLRGENAYRIHQHGRYVIKPRSAD